MFPTEEEGVCNKPPILLSYSDHFEEQYPYYLVMGMSYHDYWNGDPSLVKIYRRAESIRQDKLNYEFWLQGRYLYDAMLMVAPSYNSIHPQEPIPYYDEPLPITLKQIREREEREERKRFEHNKAMMMKFESEVNTYFKQQPNRREGDK